MLINVYDVLLRKNGKPYLAILDTVEDTGVLGTAVSTYCFIRKHTNLCKQAEEHVLLIGLNTQLQILGIFIVSKGTATYACLQPREIFQRLLLVGATGFIVAHNHPSGVLNASECDVEAIKSLKELSETMGLTFFDSLIVTHNSYMSFKQENLVWQ